MAETQQGEQAAPTTPREPWHRAWRSGWRAHLLLLIGFAVLATPLVVHEATSNRAFSVYDEWQYADRVYTVATGDYWMGNGELISDWAQGARACRGIERVVGPQPAPCWGKEPVPMPNSAAPDPPFYYWATGTVTGLALDTGLTDNPVTTGRLMGVVWAALSMWSLFLLSRALGASRAAGLVAASTVLLVPLFRQQYHYITPHALDIPAGAFAALVLVRTLRREWPSWTLVLAGLGIAGVKGSNMAVLVALGLTLVVIICWPGKLFARADRLRALVSGVVLTLSTVGFTLLWMWLVELTEVVDEVPPPGDYLVDSLDPAAMAVDSVRFMAAFGEGAIVVPNAWLMAAMVGTALVLWSGLAQEPRPYVRPLAGGYVLGVAAAPLFLNVMVFVSTGQYIGIQMRYGIALLAVGVALASLLLRTRTAVVLGAAVLVVLALTPMLAGLDSIAH